MTSNAKISESCFGDDVKVSPGTYYMVIGDTKVILVPEIENYPTRLAIGPSEIVLCKEVVFRKGGQGRGKYAKFHVLRGKKVVIFYERVSNNEIGRGGWEVVPPLHVLARANETGLL